MKPIRRMYANIPGSTNEWTDESPQESVDSQAAATLDFINGVSDNAPGSEGLPNTFRFKTRTGHVGLLQITGFTEHPRGVKLRYKLVQNGGTIKNQFRRQPDQAHLFQF